MSNEITTVRRSLAPTTFSEAFDFAQHLAKSTMVPAAFQGKPENILLAMQWGAELGLAPLQAIQNIAVINGKPSVYGDALLAMVRGSSVCDDVIESFDGEGDNLTAVCTAKRRGKEPVVARFSIEDAKKANLWGKTGPWQQYPRRMLQMRARGFALRDAFPDVLRGVITREEAEDYPVDAGKPRAPIDITPPRDKRQAIDRHPQRGETIDNETGEILDARQIELDARAAAAKGTDAFREHLRRLSREERGILNGKVGTKDQPGELLTLALRTDEALRSAPSDDGPADEFGLPVSEPHPNSTTVQEKKTARYALPRSPQDRDFAAFAQWIDEQLSDGMTGAVIRADHHYELDKLKAHDWEAYEVVMAKLASAK